MKIGDDSIPLGYEYKQIPATGTPKSSRWSCYLPLAVDTSTFGPLVLCELHEAWLDDEERQDNIISYVNGAPRVIQDMKESYKVDLEHYCSS